MSIAIPLVGFVFRVGPLTYAFLGCVAVPFAVDIGQVEVLKACSVMEGPFSGISVAGA